MAHSLAHGESDSLFHRCLVGSAVFHIGLLLLGGISLSLELMTPAEGLVIDLTLPLRDKASPGMGPLGLPPTAPPLAVSKPIVAPPPVVVEEPAPEPEPVVVSEPEPELIPVAASEPEPVVSAVIEAPVAPEPPKEAPVAPAPPAAVGSPLGLPGGIGTTPGAATTGPEGGGGTSPAGRTANPEIMPRLLNKDEVLKNLRRFYPEAERLAGRESKVIVKIRIGISGKVENVDVMRSGGAAFDAGAKAVANRMRFSPAILEGRPVAVALPQLIVFQLE